MQDRATYMTWVTPFGPTLAGSDKDSVCLWVLKRPSSDGALPEHFLFPVDWMDSAAAPSPPPPAPCRSQVLSLQPVSLGVFMSWAGGSNPVVSSVKRLF